MNPRYIIGTIIAIILGFRICQYIITTSNQFAVTTKAMSDNLIKFPFVPVSIPGSPEVISMTDLLIEKNNKSVVVVSPWPEDAWLGISRNDIDGKGYKSKGAFFGGPKNLSDGGGLLVSQWVNSETVFAPEAIKMIADRESNSDRIGIYYQYLIDREWYNLGQAFDIPYNYLNQEASKSDPWYPVIRYSDSTYKQYSKSMNEFSVIFESTSRLTPSTVRELPEELNGITGNWTLSKLFVGPELGEYPMDDSVVDAITFSLNESTERMNVKVGNRITGAILGLSKCQDNMKEGFCKVKVQLGASTKMMVHGPLGEMEEKITTLLPHVTKLHIDEDTIIMNGHDVELILVKGDNQVTTYTASSNRDLQSS